MAATEKNCKKNWACRGNLPSDSNHYLHYHCPSVFVVVARSTVDVFSTSRLLSLKLGSLSHSLIDWPIVCHPQLSTRPSPLSSSVLLHWSPANRHRPSLFLQIPSQTLAFSVQHSCHCCHPVAVLYISLHSFIFSLCAFLRAFSFIWFSLPINRSLFEIDCLWMQWALPVPQCCKSLVIVWDICQ